MNPRIYRSKVDWWIAAILVLTIGMGIAGAIASRAYYAIAVFPIVVFGLLIPIRYEVTDTDLIVQSGMAKFKFPIQDILEVKPSRLPWSSPAWSLDRLLIRGQNRAILVSPEDKASFIQALRDQDKRLTLVGTNHLQRDS